MKSIIFILMFVALSISTVAQNTMSIDRCNGEEYRAVAADVLHVPYKDEKNWVRLVKVNPILESRQSFSGGEYTATFFVGELVCIPKGLTVDDFIDNGKYAPSLVRSGGSQTALTATTVSFERVVWYVAIGFGLFLLLALLAGIYLLFRPHNGYNAFGHPM